MMHSSGVWERDLTPEPKMLFDYVRCSMDIGVLTDVTCETVSLGGNMGRYWVSPAGQLFFIDYEGTHDFVIITESSPEYDHQYTWRNTSVKPNGSHGAVAPVAFTGTLYIAPNRVLQPEFQWEYRVLDFEDGLCQLE